MWEKSSATKDSKPKAKQNIEGRAKPMLSRANDGPIFHLSPKPQTIPFSLYVHHTYIPIDMYIYMYAKSLANNGGKLKANRGPGREVRG